MSMKLSSKKAGNPVITADRVGRFTLTVTQACGCRCRIPYWTRNAVEHAALNMGNTDCPYCHNKKIVEETDRKKRK